MEKKAALGFWTWTSCIFPVCWAVWSLLLLLLVDFVFRHMTNPTSLCLADEQNAQCDILQRPLILHCFYDKAVPPHVWFALWPEAFASSKHARWWRKVTGQRTALRGQESPNPSSPSQLKSNNFTKCRGALSQWKRRWGGETLIT